MPAVDVKTIEIAEKEIDVLIIHNSNVTPYYLLKDYAKADVPGKSKTVIHAGVIYSRIGDRNTSSAECATKQDVEFLWKKRFGLVGSDSIKVIKRLRNVDDWYSSDEYDTFFNREYSDIRIERDSNYNLEVKLSEDCADIGTWVMDFPYLFASMLNWNIGDKEIGRRAKWDIFWKAGSWIYHFMVYKLQDKHIIILNRKHTGIANWEYILMVCRIQLSITHI